MEFDPSTLSIVVGTVLPLLVGIVTKEVRSGGLRATLLALFSAATGMINVAIDNGGVLSSDSVVAAAITWTVAVATYYGYWKPSHVSGKINEKTSEFGV